MNYNRPNPYDLPARPRRTGRLCFTYSRYPGVSEKGIPFVKYSLFCISPLGIRSMAITLPVIYLELGIETRTSVARSLRALRNELKGNL